VVTNVSKYPMLKSDFLVNVKHDGYEKSLFNCWFAINFFMEPGD
jgi:hypothetical protein